MLFIIKFITDKAHVVQRLYHTGAWKTLPCDTMAQYHKPSYTSYYCIVNCQKGQVFLPRKALAHPQVLF